MVWTFQNTARRAITPQDKCNDFLQNWLVQRNASEPVLATNTQNN